MKTKELAMNAVLAAMCAVLGYISLDFGNIKITFETIPILMAAMMFGPWSGFAVGTIGTLIYQVLRYGITVTTPLWIFPYAFCGLLAGWYSLHKNYSLIQPETVILIVANELLITLLNTAVMYIDSKIYGYYSFVYIFGTFILRLVICIVKAVAFAYVIPPLIRIVRKGLKA